MSADEPAMSAAREYASHVAGMLGLPSAAGIALTRGAVHQILRDAYLAGFAAATAQNAALVAKTIAEHAGPERRTGSRSVP